MVPEADRVILEQQCADLGVRSRLGPGGIVFEVLCGRVQQGAEGDGVGVSGGRDALDPAVGREQEVRLAAFRRQRPEGRDLLVRIRFRVRIGPGGGEQQRAVARESGRRFARARARQPARRDLARGVDLPQGRPHLVGLGAEARDRDDQAPAIGRQLQAGKSGGGIEPVQSKRFVHERIIAQRRQLVLGGRDPDNLPGQQGTSGFSASPVATGGSEALLSFRGPQRAFGRGVAQLGSAHRSGR